MLLLFRQPSEMALLKAQFRKKHSKSLKEWVFSETSGAYRDALLLMIGDT